MNSDSATKDLPCTLALSMGEPAGIGPEVVGQALRQLDRSGELATARILYFGDAQLLPPDVQSLPQLEVQQIELAAAAVPGQANPANAQAVIESIRLATASCLSGQAQGLVTPPINKSVLYAASFEHPGHTEFLAQLCGCAQPSVMMLAAPQMSVVPITLHVSLERAIAQIREQGRELICHACRVTHASLQSLGIARPRLGVSGLNPHAGEQGTMGWEEQEIIEPAIRALCEEEGLDVSGPHPADTLFDQHNRQRFDCILAMTHDQALIPIKTLAFDQAVNVTLGLPIIRTSPDHGTAFDIAGQGIARPESMLAAIRYALAAARRKKSLDPEGDQR